MRFARRQVKSIKIMRYKETIYQLDATDKIVITVFAHTDDETNSQLLGIESVDKTTGEVTTQRINLPVTDMYIVSVIEILEIEQY